LELSLPLLSEEEEEDERAEEDSDPKSCWNRRELSPLDSEDEPKG